ncbi:Uncharacterized protein DAT39_007005 [Clarias magur]|uniref:Uncharacterized protein n=1 Tax=Clarias magur TaxID=1594786 RepID=A0A8J4X5W1_CLAMG|nr:Uncharacterized protein DAT39_007005 [Clarias magur]
MSTKLIPNAESKLLCILPQKRCIVRVNKRCFSISHGSIVRAMGGHAVIGGVLRAATEVEAQTDGLGSRTTERRPPRFAREEDHSKLDWIRPSRTIAGEKEKQRLKESKTWGGSGMRWG